VKLLIPANIAVDMTDLLRRRGLTETGGVLMGEHVGPDAFRVIDYTSQRGRATFASFLRVPQRHIRKLRGFFRRTGHDYQRFNYLGEWHSHPSFSVEPSQTDLRSMVDLINDPGTAATFAVLLIVRLGTESSLEIGAYLFLPQISAAYPVEVSLEPPPVRRALRWI
jgi:integrative and conjugative element protein (TIGR02256 family)